MVIFTRKKRGLEVATGISSRTVTLRITPILAMAEAVVSEIERLVAGGGLGGRASGAAGDGGPCVSRERTMETCTS